MNHWNKNVSHLFRIQIIKTEKDFKKNFNRILIAFRFKKLKNVQLI